MPLLRLLSASLFASAFLPLAHAQTPTPTYPHHAAHSARHH